MVSEIREQARAALEAFGRASSTADEAEAERHLKEALSHLGDAAGIPLREADDTPGAALPNVGSVEELEREIRKAGPNPSRELREHLRQQAVALGADHLIPHDWRDQTRESSRLREVLAYADGGDRTPLRAGETLLGRLGLDRDEYPQ